MAVQFKEQDAHEKTSAFVAIDERVVVQDSGCVRGSQSNHVGAFAIREKLPRPGEGGFEQRVIAKAHGAAVESQKTTVKRKSVALVDPNRLSHFARVCSVLR